MAATQLQGSSIEKNDGWSMIYEVCEPMETGATFHRVAMIASQSKLG